MHLKYIQSAGFLIVSGLLSATAVAKMPDAPPGSVDAEAAAMWASDIATLGKLHATNLGEIEHAKLAIEKAQSPEVKAYARSLLADHTAADKAVLAYVSKSKVPTTELDKATTVEQEKQKSDPVLISLHQLTGDAFDKQFTSSMAGAHQNAIDAVKSARDTTKDRSFKALLGTLLPTLEKHRDTAKKLSEKFGKSS